MRAALAWMARDCGLRLDLYADGRVELRAAGPDEPIGKPESGAIPAPILKASLPKISSLLM